MRIAMGLALKEDDKNARAIEFYNVLSSIAVIRDNALLAKLSRLLNNIDDDNERIPWHRIQRN